MPAEESTPAIVLRARDYSESDRIVTLLTRDFGKLSGMAKGAKASRRRFERKLEPFSHVMLYFRRRPHGQLVFVTRAEMADGIASIDVEGDLGKIALGSYLLEFTDALTSEQADAAGAYRALIDALTAMTASGASQSLRQAFELRMLAWAGFGLDFGRCRGCAASIAGETSAVYFVVSRGGVVCTRCRSSIPEGAIRMEASSASTLAALANCRVADAVAMPHGCENATAALARFISTVLDRRLRSAAFLDSIMPLNGSRQ
ncbi:MAG TPA: DNA repair protein RecO [Candidatus Binataceae bacterium]|nr:DNA repair protein RecO [Candidatus Binataceae bacterium]